MLTTHLTDVEFTISEFYQYIRISGRNFDHHIYSLIDYKSGNAVGAAFPTTVTI